MPKKKWTKADYRSWCRKLGRRNVRNGHLKRIQKIGASLGGLVQGPINAVSGHMKAIQRIGASLGGKIVGAAHVLSGHIHRIRTREGCQRGGRMACHNRYHQNRFNPRCEICLELASVP